MLLKKCALITRALVVSQNYTRELNKKIKNKKLIFAIFVVDKDIYLVALKTANL